MLRYVYILSGLCVCLGRLGGIVVVVAVDDDANDSNADVDDDVDDVVPVTVCYLCGSRLFVVAT